MRPVIIHADGTDCHHEGSPQATMLDGAPLCSAGMPVTHVRFNGQTITLEQAAVAFGKMAQSVAEAMKPIAAAFAKLGRRIAEDPALRALAARTEAEKG